MVRSKIKQTLVERDGTVCGLCGLPLYLQAPLEPTKNGQRMQKHPCAPTVDHITPISLGGSRKSLSNLRLAHRYCNNSRGNGEFTLGPKYKKKVFLAVLHLGLSVA